MSLIAFQEKFPTEESCLKYLEEQRWSSGRYCPHCGSYENSYRYNDGRLFKCRDCNKQFTVKVGTIFSDSHVPLQKWFMAIYLNTSLKKGLSSIQLSKYIGVTQKSAWFMLQRIRYSSQSTQQKLKGTIEVDETYMGGVRHGGRTGPADKSIVFGAVERKGKVSLTHVPTSGARVLQPIITKTIEASAKVYSDQHGSYKGLGYLGYKHEAVNHSHGEYARSPVHTNTIDGGVWKHFKKSIDAIYMQVSVKHLQLYCNEFEYRYNTRWLSDGERFEKWFGLVNNKRLKFKNLVG
ncbi:MAG TPA: IS1595 family transposase [Candidatus Saccharimonadales bacterium]